MKSIILSFLLANTLAIKITDDPVCSSAGCTQYLHPEVDGFKKNYFVPDFGVDKDIVSTEDSIEKAEE